MKDYGQRHIKKERVEKSPEDKTAWDQISDVYRNFVTYMRGSSNLKQSFAAISLSIITDVIAGLFLGSLEETLLLLPGLLVLIPGAMSMRGNIFGALGSRLGTAFHMKRIDSFDLNSKYVRNNIYSSITLTIFTSIALGFIARGLLLLAGFPSAGVLHLILVSFLGGIISGAVLLVITFGISFTAHKRKWDPDNVTAPLLTALGDFFTIPSLAFAAHIILGLPDFYVLLSSVFVMAIAVVNLVMVFTTESTHDAMVFREGSMKTIILQSVIVMLFAGTLSATAGLILQSNLDSLLAVAIVIALVPAFLEEGGNIGNILSSRMATRLHTGRLEPKFKFDGDIRREIVSSFVLSVLVFPIVSALVYIFGGGHEAISLGKFVYSATMAGVILSVMIIAISITVSFVSFKHKINPDNVTIPLITGAADVLGVLTLLYIMQLFGIL